MATNVSKMVSTNRISTPPSIKALACSLNAAATLSNVTARNPGSFTSGERERVLFVGPIDPATNLGFSGVFKVNSSAAFFAS